MSTIQDDLKDQDPIEGTEQETENGGEESAGQTQDIEQPVESEIEILQAQLKTEKEKFLRLFAEFENYKRRTAKERVELFNTAGEGVLRDMIPVLDDFDRAMTEIRKTGDEQLVSGVELISNKFRSTLVSKKLKECEVEVGDVFDADMHEAITQIPAPNEDMKGKIVDIVEKGYKLGEKIIRYPKVVIGQ